QRVGHRVRRSDARAAGRIPHADPARPSHGDGRCIRGQPGRIRRVGHPYTGLGRSVTLTPPATTLPMPQTPARQWVPGQRQYDPAIVRNIEMPGHYADRTPDARLIQPPMTIPSPSGGRQSSCAGPGAGLHRHGPWRLGATSAGSSPRALAFPGHTTYPSGLSRRRGITRTTPEPLAPSYPLIHAHPPWTFLRVWRGRGGADPLPRLALRVSATRVRAGPRGGRGWMLPSAAHPDDERGNESLTGDAATRILDALRRRHLLRESCLGGRGDH